MARQQTGLHRHQQPTPGTPGRNHPRPISVSDHDIYVEFNIATVKKKQMEQLIPLYNKADWDSLREAGNKLGKEVEEMKATASSEEL